MVTAIPIRERILTALRAAGNGLTTGELVDVTGVAQSHILTASAGLIAAGVVTRQREPRKVASGTVYYTKPLWVYRLAEEAQ